MLFWVISAGLVLLVTMAILAPLRRAGDAGAAPAGSAAYDLQIYRDQLREVERDLTRGVISDPEAERLRREIGRKVLDADRRLTDDATPARNRSGWIGAAVVLALMLGGAVWLYTREGVPGMPDLPLQDRLAAAQAAYDSRPSQADAQAAAPAPERGQIDQDYQALVAELRAAVAETPDDPQGLALLSLHEARLGNLDAAITAQRHLIKVRGDQATADDHVQLAAQMIEAAGGLVTPEAEAELAHALKLDRRNPQARYMLGLMQAQNGRPDRAFPIWRDLLEEGPPDAPWIAPIRATIGELAWLAGQPDYTPPDAPALPGPDADAMAAAEDMSPEDRQQMIQGMVAQLESRLATEGGAPEEWARLISSLVVLGQGDRAGAIWAEAQTRFADQPEALDIVRAGAVQAGLAE